MIDHSSFAQAVVKLKPEKYSGLNGNTAIPVECSTNWAIKPTDSWSHCEFVIYPWMMRKYVWKKTWLIIADIHLKYMIFHIFICILCHQRVYYKITKWPAPSWLDSSVGRALHRYRRGHGSESHAGLTVFSGFNFTTAKGPFASLMLSAPWYSDPEFRVTRN